MENIKRVLPPACQTVLLSLSDDFVRKEVILALSSSLVVDRFKSSKLVSVETFSQILCKICLTFSFFCPYSLPIPIFFILRDEISNPKLQNGTSPREKNSLADFFCLQW